MLSKKTLPRRFSLCSPFPPKFSKRSKDFPYSILIYEEMLPNPKISRAMEEAAYGDCWVSPALEEFSVSSCGIKELGRVQ